MSGRGGGEPPALAALAGFQLSSGMGGGGGGGRATFEVASGTGTTTASARAAAYDPLLSPTAAAARNGGSGGGSYGAVAVGDISSSSSSSTLDEARGAAVARGATVQAGRRAVSAMPPARPPPVESFTYPEPDSAVYEAYCAAQAPTVLRCRTFTRWVINVAIAMFVALVAVLVTYATHNLAAWRFDALDALIAKEQAGDLNFGAALGGLVAVSAAYAAAGAVPTALVAPAAAGSGISEVKCILNGVMLPRVLQFKTLVVKVWGLIFAVGSGLPVGREGPMIHTGAIAGSGISQGKSTTLRCDLRCWSLWSPFRNDREKRDFIACGAAAGVAAAFGAPIGGVLFAIEEGASHWHRQLVWRTFFCAVVASWFLQLMLSGVAGAWGDISSSGMFNFGTFDGGGTPTGLSWSAWEMPFFVGLGAVGGVVGALFIGAQSIVSRIRFVLVPVTSPAARVLEVLVIVVAKCVAEYFLASSLGVCAPRPAASASTAAGVSYVSDLATFYCAEGQYNDLASLFLVPSEDAIRQLFHFSQPFSLTALALFTGTYLAFMCITYGVAVPAGVFIPALLTGSALGRLVGEALTRFLSSHVSVNAGVYALVGAAAVLGGVTRMTISLAVILLECTGTYEYALPITTALLAARFVGNWFSPGIYDLHIALRRWPLLPDHILAGYARQLRTCDVMAKPPLVLREVERAGTVVDTLAGVAHGAFPVVYTDRVMAAQPHMGNLAGIITRDDLSVIITRRAFHPTMPTMPLESAGGGADVGAEEDDYPAGRRGGSGGGSSRPAAAAPLPAPARRPSIRRARQVVAAPEDGSGDATVWRSWWARQRWRSGRARPQLAPAPAVRLRMPTVSGAINDQLLAAVRDVTRRRGVGADTSGSARRDASSGGAGGGRPASSTYAITVMDANRWDALRFVGNEDMVELEYADEPLLAYKDMAAYYPRFPDGGAIALSDAQRSMYMDLRPYMNATPHTVHMHAPLTRAFDLFRSLALRHLVVVNDCHDVVGILTRHDFMEGHLAACLARKRARAANRTHVDLEAADESAGASLLGARRRGSSAAGIPGIAEEGEDVVDDWGGDE